MKPFLKIVHLVLAILGTQHSFADIEILSLYSHVFNNTRSIRVYLPPGYSVGGKRYPILYLTDGIASFHAYQLEKVVDSLILHDRIKPLIIVGMDNGGSTKESVNAVRDRANEYLPWSDLMETDSALVNFSPKGRQFQHFLFTEIIPLVEKKYRTKSGRKNIALGGASYGALVSLYTATKNPNKIGHLLLESPSLYVHDHQIFKESLERLVGIKTYIGTGTMEGDSEAIQEMALDDCGRLKSRLITRNKVHLEISPGADHSYESFASRFPIALEFLFND